MKLDTNMGCYMNHISYLGKLLFGHPRGQKVKFGPKFGFFQNISRTLTTYFFDILHEIRPQYGVLYEPYGIISKILIWAPQGAKRSNLARNLGFLEISQERYIVFFDILHEVRH